MVVENEKYVGKSILKSLSKNKTIFQNGEMAERFKAVDCKSIEFSHRRFESYFLLKNFSSIKFEIWRSW